MEEKDLDLIPYPDRTTVVIAAHIMNMDLDSIFYEVTEELDSLIKGHQFYKEIDKTKCLAKEAAVSYFRNCHQVLVDYLKNYSRRFSSVEWLWYLRRVPNEVFSVGSDSKVTAGRRRLIAEIISSMSTKICPVAIGQENNILFSTDKEDIWEVIAFCVGAIYLYRIEVKIRIAGKGSKFRFTENFPVLPESLVDEHMNYAIDIYDNRLEQVNFAYFGRTGTVVAEFYEKNKHEKFSTKSGVPVILGVFPVKPTIHETYIGPVGSRKTFSMITNYAPALIALNRLSKLLHNMELPNIAVRETLGALITLLKIMIPAIHRSAVALYTIERTGYYVADDKFINQQSKSAGKTINQELETIFPTICFDKTIEEALFFFEETIEPSTLPVTGAPIIRRQGTLMFIDLISATQWLQVLLDFSNYSGGFARTRSLHFEDSVQEIIDSTSWIPKDSTRELIRRQLRDSTDSFITDIDAIGEKGNQLLIVSCKGIAFSGNYDMGSYKTVRNIRTELEEAAAHWIQIKKPS
ncbi:MAG TPA: hypothetical protein PL103_05210 [Saccharofermentans sp.]|jgi:hypothetical protein|nr:hypothetical protein [Saccharofermentans sp.]